MLGAAQSPPEGQVRALRRLLKTLASDVYVEVSGENPEALSGVVALGYRRSLRHTGLVGTIDTLACLQPPPDGVTPEGSLGETQDLLPAPDAAALQATFLTLLRCAIWRAQRRGCVLLEAPGLNPAAEPLAHAAGFVAVQGNLWLRFERPHPASDTTSPAQKEDA